jgi:hypothetical protein
MKGGEAPSRIKEGGLEGRSPSIKILPFPR